MKRRAEISIDELPLEARAKLPELGPNSPLRREVDESIERSQRGRRRQRAGAGFEAELEAVHQLYALKGQARVIRLKAPARWDAKLKHFVLDAGGGPCDFRGTLANGQSVTFDAKSWEPATYTHEPKQLHQLQELLDEDRMRAIAFLLVRVPSMHLAYLIRDRVMLSLLRSGKSIELRSAVWAGKGSGRRQANDPDAFTHHFPVLREPTELLISQSVPRWDWLSIVAPPTR